jgi:hypothetical protein
MFGPFRRKPRADGFWNWLIANTPLIQSGNRDDLGRLSQELARAFHSTYPDLKWEITPAQSGPWLFCISADGNPELFPAVEQAVRQAPSVPRWTIQAFRQRGPLTAVLDMGGRTLGYDDIWCGVERVDGRLDVTLWIRGLDPDNVQALGGAALLLLDNAVGEYDAVTRIGRLHHGPLPSDPRETPTFFPLTLLPAYLDATTET